MHLGDRAGRAVVLDLPEKVRIEVAPDPRARAGCAWGPRSRRPPSPELLRRSRARRRSPAPSRVAIRATVAPVRISAPAAFAAAARACVSAPMPPRTKVADPAALASSAAPHEDAEARPGRPGPRERAVDAPGGDRRPQQLRFEELADQIGHGHRAPAQQPERVAAGQRAELPAHAEQPPELPERRVVDRGRRHRREGLEEPADPAEGLVEREVTLRVVGRGLSDLGGRLCGVAVEHAAPARPEPERTRGLPSR